MELKPDSYTIREASNKLLISEDAVRKRIKRGALNSYKIGGRVYVVIPTDAELDIRQNMSISQQSLKNNQILSDLDTINAFKLFKETTTINIELLREQCLIYKNKTEDLEEKIKELEELNTTLNDKNTRLVQKNKDLFNELVNTKETINKKPKKKK